MKIYVVGAVSSGKTTLAKRLSATLGTPYYSLDEVVHIPDKSSPWGNVKRQEEERDQLFHVIIEQPEWIIEDVGRTCFEAGMKEANVIILLETPSVTRNYRIIKRWLKQRLGFEKCFYAPRLMMLVSMLKWSRDYDLQRDGLKGRLHQYSGKISTLRNSKAINALMEQLQLTLL